MSVTFTKLFSSITESTVWCEPDRTRLVWITMLAMADKNGRVWASIPGLANRARVPVEDARAAINTFLAPDPDSRTPDSDGRRIEPIDGGWRLLNYGKYRAVRDEEDRRQYKADHEAKRRAKLRGQNGQSWTPVDPNGHNAEAEAEAEAIKEQIHTSPSATSVVGEEFDDKASKPKPTARQSKRRSNSEKPYDLDFLRAYEAYPKHAEKSEAEVEYLSALESLQRGTRDKAPMSKAEAIEYVEAGARDYASQMRAEGRETSKIKSMNRWFTKGTYLDYAPKPKTIWEDVTDTPAAAAWLTGDAYA